MSAMGEQPDSGVGDAAAAGVGDSAAAGTGGTGDIPYRFSRSHSAAQVIEGWSHLADGEESGETVAVAGRLMLLRPQGKLAFGELRDASGAVQLFALAAVTAGFDEFSRLNLGDWIGRAEISATSGTAYPMSRPGTASAKSTSGPTSGHGSS